MLSAFEFVQIIFHIVRIHGHFTDLENRFHLIDWSLLGFEFLRQIDKNGRKASARPLGSHHRGSRHEAFATVLPVPAFERPAFVVRKEIVYRLVWRIVSCQIWFVNIIAIAVIRDLLADLAVFAGDFINRCA